MLVQVIRLPWSPVREGPQLTNGDIPPPNPLNQVIRPTNLEIEICHTPEEIFKKPVLKVSFYDN